MVVLGKYHRKGCFQNVRPKWDWKIAPEVLQVNCEPLGTDPLLAVKSGLVVLSCHVICVTLKRRVWYEHQGYCQIYFGDKYVGLAPDHASSEGDEKAFHDGEKLYCFPLGILDMLSPRRDHVFVVVLEISGTRMRSTRSRGDLCGPNVV